MAVIEVPDIMVAKGGAWSSLRGGAVAKDGFKTFDAESSVAKNGNWYVLDSPDYTLVGGVKWAKTNLIADPNDETGMTSVFADRTDYYGDFYQWGRKKAWNRDSLTGWENVTVAGENGLWPAAGNPCPAGWRLPTITEYNILEQCYCVAVEANERDNTVDGMFFGDSSDVATIADPKGCIFMPAAGRIENGTYHIGWGIRGWHWLQGESSADNAYNFHFFSGEPYIENNPKIWGFSLRCVKI